MEVLGPGYSDGIGHFRRIDKIYTYDSENKESCLDTNDEWHKIKEMSDFASGFWNESDYVMSSILLGVSSLPKVVSSTSNNSGAGNIDYTSTLWGKIESEGSKPAEPLPPERGTEALANLEDINSKAKYMSRDDAERELGILGYTPEEIQYAVENINRY